MTITRRGQTNQAADIALDRDREVVRQAYDTPQGRALIDLLLDRYGYPGIAENNFRAYTQLGSFWVTTWLRGQLRDNDG